MEGESSAKLKGPGARLASPARSSPRPGASARSGKSGRGNSQALLGRTELARALRNPGADLHAGALRVGSMAHSRPSDPDRSSDEADDARLETLVRWRGIARVR